MRRANGAVAVYGHVYKRACRRARRHSCGRVYTDMQYQDARNLSAVGQQYEADQANQNQEAMNVYNADAQTLSTFLSMLGQNPLMGEVTTTMSGSSIDPMAIASGAAGALGAL